MLKSKPIKKNKKPRTRRSRLDIPVHPKCAKCLPAKCCRYFSLEIDRPTSKRDYDDFLWFLSHKDISIYMIGNSWYLMVHTACVHLDPQANLCKIYEDRPKMCREHSVDECEFDSDYGFDEHFKSYEDLKRWLKKKKIIKK